MENRPYMQYFKDVEEDKRAEKLFYKFLFVLLIMYLLILLVSVSFYAKYEYITVEGSSMLPTLNNRKYNNEPILKDGVYIEKTTDVDYNDIIIIDRSEGDQKRTIIKRVIAKEGDYFTIAKVGTGEGAQYRVLRLKKGSRNIEILEEDYVAFYDEWSLFPSYVENGVRYERQTYERFVELSTVLDFKIKLFNVPEAGGEVKFFEVPEGYLFYLGDNRPGSSDARVNGPTPVDRIVGKVVDIVYDGSSYSGNYFWWAYRMGGFFEIIWDEILSFFNPYA